MTTGAFQAHEGSHTQIHTGWRLNEGGPTGLLFIAIDALQILRAIHEHLEALFKGFLVGHDRFVLHSAWHKDKGFVGVWTRWKLS
jgi:hypothetical protein